MDELTEPFERMLGQLFPPARVRAIDGGGTWDEEHAEIDRSGFLDALGSLSCAEVTSLWRAIGRHAAPLAIGEAMIARASPTTEESAASHALLLAAAISGAADKALEMTAAYAGERTQFGKPIGRQQAIQQQLAVMAEDCVSVRLAVEVAGGEATWPEALRAAAAKAIASAAAPRIANTAHCVHGAIGISAEYDLQLYTRRLHEWRLAGGAEGRWNREIGHAMIASHAPVLDWTRARLFGET
jgi:acyl-CoA dehydrogenase